MNASSLLIVTVATLMAIVIIAVTTNAEVGRNLDIMDGLMGAFLIEVGAVAGVSAPRR